MALPSATQAFRAPYSHRPYSPSACSRHFKGMYHHAHCVCVLVCHNLVNSSKKQPRGEKRMGSNIHGGRKDESKIL